MAEYSQNLQQLRAQPWWAEFVRKVLIPGVPEIDSFHRDYAGRGYESAWRFESGQRDGYLLALQQLGITYYE